MVSLHAKIPWFPAIADRIFHHGTLSLDSWAEFHLTTSFPIHRTGEFLLHYSSRGPHAASAADFHLRAMYIKTA